MDDIDWVIVLRTIQKRKQNIKIKRLLNNARPPTVRSIWKCQLFLNREEEGEYFRIREVLRNNPSLFQKYYRMSIESFDKLLKILQLGPVYCNGVSKEECLTITIRYFAAGSNFTAMSFAFRLAHNTIGKIVKRTSIAIWNALQKQYMRIPDAAGWKMIAEDMFQYREFPNCLGALDGKHVRIQKPFNSGSLFSNFKHYLSTVLMAVVNANYEFVMIDVGSYGHISDSGIFKNISFGEKLFKKELDIPEATPYPGTNSPKPFTLLGDEAFPLCENIMRPFSNPATHGEEVYNLRHSRARMNVECAFGMLRSKFRLFDSSICCSIETIIHVVKACCILHNFIRVNDKTHVRESYFTSLKPSMTLTPLQPASANDLTFEGTEVRGGLINYFVNLAKLFWQDEKIKRIVEE